MEDAAALLLRALEAEEDFPGGGGDITTRGMRTDVAAVGEATCCNCIRDAPARLCCISRTRSDK